MSGVTGGGITPKSKVIAAVTRKKARVMRRIHRRGRWMKMTALRRREELEAARGVLLLPALAAKNRVSGTRVKLVFASGRPLAGLSFNLYEEPSRGPWALRFPSDSCQRG